MDTVAVIGLASLYVWYVIARATIGDRIFRVLRETRANMLVGCPWCAGFWITGAVTLVTGYDILTHLAAAGVVGLLGALSD